MIQVPRVLALTGDETGSAMWRVYQPFRALTAEGFVADWEHKDNAEKLTTRIGLGYYDAIVTPRIVWPQERIGDMWLRSIHNAGVAFIYEADDDIWSEAIVGRQMRIFESERKKGEAQLEWQRQQRIKLVQQADGIIVSTDRLRTIVQQYTTRPVVVVPNAIDVAWFREQLRLLPRFPKLQNKLTIGWSGGSRDSSDLRPLVQAWGTLSRRYPDVQFVLQGHHNQELIDAVPPGRIDMIDWMPAEWVDTGWTSLYPAAFRNFDIGCCAVAPLIFNTSKSPIKWYEYTVGGACCVVSPTVYGKVVTDGHDALVASTGEEWTNALERLIVDPELRTRMRRNARTTVLNRYSLRANLANWPNAWAEILEEFRYRPRLALPA